MKDISEAIVAGHSTQDLERLAVPMTGQEEKGRMNAAFRGYQRMEKAVSEIVAEESRDIQKQAIVGMLNHTEELAAAWLKFEPEMTRDFLRIQNINGLGTSVETLHRLVKATARNLKKKIRRDAAKNSAGKPTHPKHHPEEHVTEMLSFKSGKPEATKLNIEIILRHDTRWKGRVRQCEFDGMCHYNNNPVTDLVEAKTDSWISKTYGIETNHRTLGTIMSMIGHDDPYHPVREWLDSLQWDGTHRLKDMAEHIYRSPDCNDENRIDVPKDKICKRAYYQDLKSFGFETEEDAPAPHVVSIYFVRMMIGACARAFDQGCKLDYVPIMIGNQGVYKSQGIECLVPERSWMSDTKFDIKSKDAYQSILGKWIVELPECATLHVSGYNHAKSFLSSAVDRYRPPYGRHVVDQPRGCIFIGTTNEKQLGFLNDMSGTRRYWTFQVGRIAFKQLAQDNYIHQIWAEARHLYNTANQWWLRDWEEPARHRLNEQYRQVDTWEDSIQQWINERIADALAGYHQWQPEEQNAETFGGTCEFSTLEALTEAIRVPTQFQKKTDITRASKIISRIGCVPGRKRRFGKTRTRCWAIPTEIIAKCIKSYRFNQKTRDSYFEIIESWE